MIGKVLFVNNGNFSADTNKFGATRREYRARMYIYSRGSAHVHRDASLERQLPASRERERDGVIRS